MTLHAATAHKPRRRTDADDELTHPLLGDQPTLQLIQPRESGTDALPLHLIAAGSVAQACQAIVLSAAVPLRSALS